MATTERGDYRFTVKEYADGTPWIMLELMKGPDVPPLRNGFIGFDFKEPKTDAEAQEISRFMNDNLGLLAYTNIKG